MTSKLALEHTKDPKFTKQLPKEDYSYDIRTTPTTIEKASIEWQKDSIMCPDNYRKMNFAYPIVGEAINSVLQFQMEMAKLLTEAFHEINALKQTDIQQIKTMTLDKDNLENAKSSIQGTGLLSDLSSPHNITLGKVNSNTQTLNIQNVNKLEKIEREILSLITSAAKPISEKGSFVKSNFSSPHPQPSSHLWDPTKRSSMPQNLTQPIKSTRTAMSQSSQDENLHNANTKLYPSKNSLKSRQRSPANSKDYEKSNINSSRNDIKKSNTVSPGNQSRKAYPSPEHGLPLSNPIATNITLTACTNNSNVKEHKINSARTASTVKTSTTIFGNAQGGSTKSLSSAPQKNNWTISSNVPLNSGSNSARGEQQHQSHLKQQESEQQQQSQQPSSTSQNQQQQQSSQNQQQQNQQQNHQQNHQQQQLTIPKSLSSVNAHKKNHNFLSPKQAHSVPRISSSASGSTFQSYKLENNLNKNKIVPNQDKKRGSMFVTGSTRVASKGKDVSVSLPNSYREQNGKKKTPEEYLGLNTKGKLKPMLSFDNNMIVKTELDVDGKENMQSFSVRNPLRKSQDIMTKQIVQQTTHNGVNNHGDENYDNQIILRPHMGELKQKELPDESVQGDYNYEERTVTNISRDTSRYMNPNETDRTMKTIDMDDKNSTHGFGGSKQIVNPQLEKQVIRDIIKEEHGDIPARTYPQAQMGVINERKHLIDAKWWRSWKQYVGFDGDDQASTLVVNFYSRPDKILNRALLKTDIITDISMFQTDLELKDNLLEHHDYEAISQKVFDQLQKWYGCDFEIVRVLRFDPFRDYKLSLDLYPERINGIQGHKKQKKEMSSSGSIGTTNIKDIISSNISNTTKPAKKK